MRDLVRKSSYLVGSSQSLRYFIYSSSVHPRGEVGVLWIGGIAIENDQRLIYIFYFCFMFSSPNEWKGGLHDQREESICSIFRAALKPTGLEPCINEEAFCNATVTLNVDLSNGSQNPAMQAEVAGGCSITDRRNTVNLHHVFISCCITFSTANPVTGTKAWPNDERLTVVDKLQGEGWTLNTFLSLLNIDRCPINTRQSGQ